MRVIVVLSLLGIGTMLYASDSQVADLLFGNFNAHLSSSEQTEIVRQLGFTMSEDGQTLLDPVCGLPLSFETTVEDLNRDGISEIFVVGGNTCYSGGDGSSVSLFIRSESGQYQAHLGFPSAVYEMLDSTNDGFPDLKFGGRGFCRGVWRWNGKDYEHLRNEPDEPGGCDYVNKSFRDVSCAAGFLSLGTRPNGDGIEEAFGAESDADVAGKGDVLLHKGEPT